MTTLESNSRRESINCEFCILNCFVPSPLHSSQRLPQAPAAGVRDRTDGALNAVGANGDCYSSSSYATGSIYVGCLWFNAGFVDPLYGGSRAYARAVRCVQHLPGPLSRTLRPVRRHEEPGENEKSRKLFRLFSIFWGSSNPGTKAECPRPRPNPRHRPHWGP